MTRRIIIWGPSAAVARSAGLKLGIPSRDIIAVGPRNADALRGVGSAAGILILPDAVDSKDQMVTQNLAVILYVDPTIPTIDLR